MFQKLKIILGIIVIFGGCGYLSYQAFLGEHMVSEGRRKSRFIADSFNFLLDNLGAYPTAILFLIPILAICFAGVKKLKTA